MNDSYNNDYEGPCPPPGPPHNYVTSVYALSGELDVSIVDVPITRAEFESQYRSFILAIGTIRSQYEGR